MKFSKYYRALFRAFSLVLFLAACQPKEEVKQVSFEHHIIEAENFSDSSNWSTKDYYTGVSAMADNAEPDSNFVSYTFHLSNAGEYRIGVMAASRSYPVENAKLTFDINNKRVGELQVKNSRALIWTDFVPVQIADTGNVTLKIRSENPQNAKIYIDQIVLTTDPDFQPKGF